MAVSDLGVLRFRSSGEDDAREELYRLFRESPVPADELLENLGLFQSSKDLSRILFLDYLYRQIAEVEGVIIEFGTRWGQNLALFSSLRSIYEPFNRKRKVIGFDTFCGFVGLSEQDGDSPMMRPGNYAVRRAYESYLEAVLAVHERLNPLSHLRRFELRKGDAAVEVHRYFEEHPGTVVALAYFDMDLYQPTRECLAAILPRLTRGSVLGFDEVNTDECPGETLALQEVLGLGRYRLRRSPISGRMSYLVVD